MARLVIAALALVVATATADESATLAMFGNWKGKFNKTYASEADEHLRFAAFKASVVRIQARNKAETDSDASFGTNQFSDMFPVEFRTQFLGYKPKARAGAAIRNAPAVLSATVDWRTKGAVSAVKNQEQCGSCWAFSATEAIETAGFMQTGTMNILSPEQIVSCDTVDQGCNGGDTTTAYQYVQGAGGMVLDSDFPYTAGGGTAPACTLDTTQIVTGTQVSGFTYGTPACTASCDNQNSATMVNNLVANGPASICVYAESWQDYTSGVLTGAANCPHAFTDLDHCVQLVGVDTTASTPYWLVRNSWGSSWGEAGYIRVDMTANLCGILDEATYATV